MSQVDPLLETVTRRREETNTSLQALDFHQLSVAEKLEVEVEVEVEVDLQPEMSRACTCRKGPLFSEYPRDIAIVRGSVVSVGSPRTLP